MSMIKFSKEEKEILVDKLKGYFETELNQEVGQFEAEFLMDFISKEIGSYYYNRGLSDAQSIMQSKIDSITDALYEAELPTEFVK